MKKPHYVREWRKHRGLSQEALAERIEKTQGYVSKLERFEQDYNQGLLEALAYALMCDPADLIMRNPLQEEAIWSVWDKVPVTERPRALTILKTFINDDMEPRKVG